MKGDIESENPEFDNQQATIGNAEPLSKKKKMLLGATGFAVVAGMAAMFSIPGSKGGESTNTSAAVAGFPSIGGAAKMPIDEFLKESSAYSLTRIEDAINPPNSIPGSLIAALENVCPDYAFTWARDQALVYQVVLNEYEKLPAGDTRDKWEGMLKDFAAHTHEIFKINSNPLASGSGRDWSLAEAKVNLDGTMYTGPWCSPQTDGPAVRAIVLMAFAEIYEKYHPGDNYVAENLYKAQVTSNVNEKNPIKRDMEWLLNNWDIENCEPWEEVRGKHFYNRVVARRAFKRAVKFARSRGDFGAANAYEARIPQVEATIAPHWEPSLGTIRPEQNNNGNRLDDVQTILATIHSYSEEDEYWGTSDTRTYSNALYTIKSFDNYFAVNAMNWENQPDLGVAIGRYTGDIYNGFCNLPKEVCPDPCRGQPWFLATNAVAEFAYKAAYNYNKFGSITIDQWNKDFFYYYGAEAVIGGDSVPSTYLKGTEAFNKLITILIHAGDGFIKRTRYHTDENFRMDEQYNGDTGIQMSAVHLTWAYGSLFTANDYRQRLSPSSLIPSYTSGSELDAHVAVVRVPLDVKELVLVGNTASLGNGDACNGAKMYKRREAYGFAEWSTFVKVPKSSSITFRPASVTNGCQNPVYPESGELSVTTGTANNAEPYYSAWCSTVGCVIPNSVEAQILVTDVPSSIQQIAIVGDQPEIANWSPCGGIRGTKQSNGDWLVKVNLPTQKRIEFKAIGISGDNGSSSNCGSVQWESGGNNQIQALFSSPSSPIINIWSCENCQPVNPTPPPTLAPGSTLTFVNKNVPAEAQLVRVVGNIAALGDWNPCNGVVATKQGNDWVASAELPGSYELKFKAILFKDAASCTNDYIWEPNADNSLVTGSVSSVDNPWGN